jgi:RNA polymerase sigma factor (sigma-70 family)
MFNLDLKQEELDDLKAGRHEPFKKIFEQAYAPLCDYIKMLYGASHVVEDIAADTFEKFYKQKTRFNSAGEIINWLCKTCRHAYLNTVKHNDVEQKYIEFVENTPDTTEPAYIETAIAVTVAAEIEKLMELEIENLPLKCKEIFKLAYFEQLSSNEIAARLNISIHNVAGQKDIAIQRLKKKLSHKNFLLMVVLATLFGQKYFSEILLNFDGLLVLYYVSPADQYNNNHKFYPNA